MGEILSHSQANFTPFQLYRKFSLSFVFNFCCLLLVQSKIALSRSVRSHLPLLWPLSPSQCRHWKNHDPKVFPANYFYVCNVQIGNELNSPRLKQLLKLIHFFSDDEQKKTCAKRNNSKTNSFKIHLIKREREREKILLVHLKRRRKRNKIRFKERSLS